MIDLASSHDAAALAQHYRRFRVSERLLLTGHSHQAWPDVAAEGHVEAFDDAAMHVDAKWERAAVKAETVRSGYHRLLGDDERGTITLGTNTHELLVRLVSALDLEARPRIVTTEGEFHSARRQLDRWAENGIEVVRVPVDSIDHLGTRVAAAVDDRTALVLVSKVLFGSARIVDDLASVAAAARLHGAALCVDAYHAVNVLDWRIGDDDLGDAFVLGGGYKYLQCGEGNAFLRWPNDRSWRPVDTGWYAEFGALEQPEPGRVVYGTGPERFAGATYDPTSHYRAARVMEFFAEQDLTPRRLRAISQAQVGRLLTQLADADLDPTLIALPSGPLGQLGGFVALTSPVAENLRAFLLSAGVLCDHRGTTLRLGPAPYLTDAQLDDAAAAVIEAARSVPRHQAVDSP